MMTTPADADDEDDNNDEVGYEMYDDGGEDSDNDKKRFI